MRNGGAGVADSPINVQGSLAELAQLALPPAAPHVVTRVTVWSDGTVHIERPGEPSQVVVPLAGSAA